MKLPLVTANVDFTDGPEGSLDNLMPVLPGAAITFVQEAKYIELREELTRVIGVQQGGTLAEAGSAVLWDRTRSKVVRRGLTTAANPRPHNTTMTRYLAWVVLDVDGFTLAAIAGHRPPRRDRSMWREFDQTLRELVDGFESVGIPVVTGLDTNARFPRLLARRLGLRWKGLGIDGFMHSRRLKLSKAKRLRRTRSDHRALMSMLTLPPRWSA